MLKLLGVRARGFAFLSSFVGLSAFGCGSDPDGGPSPLQGASEVFDPELALVPGTGVQRFSAVEDGAELAWVAGFQGGYHLHVGLRAHASLLAGRNAQDIEHRYRLRASELGVLAETARSGLALSPGATFAETRGILLVLAPGWMPEAVTEFPLELQVSLRDQGQPLATASTTMTTRCCE